MAARQWRRTEHIYITKLWIMGFRHDEPYSFLFFLPWEHFGLVSAYRPNSAKQSASLDFWLLYQRIISQFSGLAKNYPNSVRREVEQPKG